MNPALRFVKTITEQDLEAHLSFLADDLLEGRETGTRGQHMAALYIQTHFKRLGLKGGMPDGSYQQYYYLQRSEINTAEININGETFTYGQQFTASRGNLPDSLSVPLVFAGYGIQEEGYDNLKGLDLQNKIALIISGSPDPEANQERLWAQIRTWRARADAFKEAGAAAVIMMMPDSVYKIMGRYARRTSMQVSDGESRAMPLIYASEAMGSTILQASKTNLDKVKASLATEAKPPKMKLKKVDLTLTADVKRTRKEASNILAFLEGTDRKDEILIITGHYDHIGIGRDGQINNGADDDGSGTTAVLEIAEAFAKAAEAGIRPRRSVLFMTVSGEEKGLLGSEFYTNHPVYPLEQTITNLNIDMVGRVGITYKDSPDSTNYVYVIGSDKLSSELHAISEKANDDFTKMVLDYTYNDEKDPNRFYYRSDHYNFAKNGIPIIFYFNGTHPDYHKPTDTVEKINFEKMLKTTQLVFHTAWVLSNRSERPIVDKADNGQ